MGSKLGCKISAQDGGTARACPLGSIVVCSKGGIKNWTVQIGYSIGSGKKGLMETRSGESFEPQTRIRAS